MRQPNIENKYNLTPFTVTRLKVNRAKVNSTYFWRSDRMGAWTLSGNTAKTSTDIVYGTYNSFLLKIYDETHLGFPGKIHLKFSKSVARVDYNYNFESFYDYTTIKNEIDLEIQENFLEKINFLIDEGVFILP